MNDIKWVSLLVFGLMCAAVTPVTAQDLSLTTEGVALTDGARARDASNDRGILTSHADTVGKDQWNFNSYQLFFAGVTYGATDRLQLSATGLIPIHSEMPIAGVISGKYAFYRGDRGVLSASLNLGGAGFADSDMIYFMGASVQGDYHLNRTVILHGGLDVQTPLEDFAQSAFIRASGGVTVQATSFMRILGEVVVPLMAEDIGTDLPQFVAANYGVRFHNKTLAADLTFVRPVGGEFSDSDFVLGVPFVAFSARF